MHQSHLLNEDFLFSSPLHASEHLSTRQYARTVKAWLTAIGLDPTLYGTHTLRGTNASRINPLLQQRVRLPIRQNSCLATSFTSNAKASVHNSTR